MRRSVVWVILGLPIAASLSFGYMPHASARDDVRREWREGRREIRRERREAIREIRNADTPEEFRREIREGIREVRREQREMRRAVQREIDQVNDRLR